VELYEIVKGRLYQSGAVEGADWQPIHDHKIDIVIDLFGTLDPDVPTVPNSILYVFWPIEDHAELPDLRMLDALTDLAAREIVDGHKVLTHCHKGKSRSGMFNAIVAMKLVGIDGRAAIELVRSGRPGALGNASFVAYLESLPAPNALLAGQALKAAMTSPAPDPLRSASGTPSPST
jgi:dual specificity protein phosphatase-like protein